MKSSEYRAAPAKSLSKWFFGARHITGKDGSYYMKRWMFWCPWFGVRIHKICRSDAGRDFHDHPWDFVSIGLWGSYTEWVPGSPPQGGSPFFQWPYRYTAPFINKKSAEALHRLELQAPVWTLVFTGPKRRTWGFQTPTGWVHWRDYDGEA